MADQTPGNEFDLIARHFAPLARAEPGAFGLTDDAAVLAVPEGRALVATTDTMVAGVHFLADLPAEAVGARLLRVNLSDLASMGAMPAAYVVSLSFPRDLSATERDDWAAGFARGLSADQDVFGVTLVGGDSVSAPGPLSLTLTAFGWIEPGREMRRSGAHDGELVYVSGTIGDAALGLEAERGNLQELAPEHRAALIDRFRRPVPRLQAGQGLVGIASAAADISDGLVADLGHICEASGVAAEIEVPSVPFSDAARAALAGHPELLEPMLTGGDDYELVFTAPKDARDAVAKVAVETGVPLTPIGTISRPASGEHGRVRVIGADGRDVAFAAGGYRHF